MTYDLFKMIADGFFVLFLFFPAAPNKKWLKLFFLKTGTTKREILIFNEGFAA